MKFSYYDLGNLKGGEIVEVTLSGSQANVRLLDSSNFSSYKRGASHRGYGGLAKKSPVHLQIPNSGHWYVVIDFGGYRGNVRHSIRVLPGMLPTIRETPLASIPSLVRNKQSEEDPFSRSDGDANPKEFDVFICHSSEDKDSVVRDLAHALRDKQLSVWYDEFELKIGDSLRRKIDLGLSRSRFGIVVLSSSFFGKGWANYELDGLVTREVTGEQILLPIWHQITKQDVINYSPSLADKVARSTATSTIGEIADEIFSVIRG